MGGAAVVRGADVCVADVFGGAAWVLVRAADVVGGVELAVVELVTADGVPAVVVLAVQPATSNAIAALSSAVRVTRHTVPGPAPACNDASHAAIHPMFDL